MMTIQYCEKHDARFGIGEKCKYCEKIQNSHGEYQKLIDAAKVAVNDLRELAADCNCNADYAKRLEEVIKSYEVI